MAVKALLSSARWRLLVRFAVIGFIVSTLVSSVFLFSQRDGVGYLARLSNPFRPQLNPTSQPTTSTARPATSLAPPASSSSVPASSTQPPEENHDEEKDPAWSHPIEKLISEAEAAHFAALQERSLDLRSATERYRQRRGRHPPPGFDAWFAYAMKHDAIIVESYFDHIYHDIAPFWAVDPTIVAKRAASWEHVVRVRNHNTSEQGERGTRVAWLPLWAALVAEAQEFLPDVDMPINYMDESRLLVPWEKINEMVQVERKNRRMPEPADVTGNHTGLAAVDADNSTNLDQPHWIGGEPFWKLARLTCPPGSLSRDAEPIADFLPPPQLPANRNTTYSYKGYVQNMTAATDPCVQPHLRGMHASFIEPVSMSSAQELIPLFGGTKLPMNNEILIPGAMYLTDDEMYSGGESRGPPWHEKRGGVVWRGVASGGRHKRENWSHFQRLRLVQMLNGTTVAGMEATGERAPTFELPPSSLYDFPRRRAGTVGEWLTSFADAGFVELLCFPKGECGYVEPWMREVAKVPMAEQYGYKFMPDVDGNSFSARFRGFVLSSSLPLKATVYAEWHDHRLVPWVHYVPLDNTFQDLYGVLDFFARDERGDAAAQKIAEAGQEWGGRVLRREDMLLYTWRVLLEFARVCDVRRENLGFVDDLLGVL